MCNFFSDIFHFLVVKPYVYFATHLEGSKVENTATSQVTALESPVVSALEGEFQAQVGKLLGQNGALTESAVVALLQPQVDTLIANAIGSVKTTNPIINAVESQIIAYAQGQVPNLINAAYSAAVAEIKKV
jgi:hypothetical protein